MKAVWMILSLALVAALFTPACMMTSTHEEILKKTNDK